MPKLTIEQMAEVFELRNKGVYWENLAVIFGVCETTLRRYHRLAQQEGFDLWLIQ